MDIQNALDVIDILKEGFNKNIKRAKTECREIDLYSWCRHAYSSYVTCSLDMVCVKVDMKVSSNLWLQNVTDKMQTVLMYMIRSVKEIINAIESEASKDVRFVDYSKY